MSTNVKLTIEDKRRRIIAYDIIEVYTEAHEGKFDYLVTLLTGDGTSPAIGWDAKTIEREWIDGEYDNPDVKEWLVKNSAGYSLVEELWP